MPLVFAHSEIGDARAAGDLVVLAFEEMIEPSQAQIVDRAVGDSADGMQARADHAFRPTPTQMLPRPDDDAGIVAGNIGRAPVLDTVEIAQGAVDEGVVPAVESQYRHL